VPELPPGVRPPTGELRRGVEALRSARLRATMTLFEQDAVTWPAGPSPREVRTSVFSVPLLES